MKKPRAKRKTARNGTAFVPRVVMTAAIAGVVPTAFAGCSEPNISLDVSTYDVTAPDHGTDTPRPFDIISLDASTYDITNPDYGVISLDVGTYDATSPDGGSFDVLISLDASTYDVTAPDYGPEPSIEGGTDDVGTG